MPATARRCPAALAGLLCAALVGAAGCSTPAARQEADQLAQAVASPSPPAARAAPSPTAPSPTSAAPATSATAPPAQAVVTPTPARPPVEAVGPFRHTARDAFAWSVGPVTAARLGSSHRAGCPLAPGELRLLGVSHWGFDGRTHRGELVVRASVASDVVEVFRRLHAARFPLQRVVTAEQYGGDDARIMAANATSSYNCRTVAGSTRFSEHAYGTAIDLNPVQNPYVRGDSVEPAAGRAYLDRTDVRPGMVVSGDAVVRAFAAAGWEWGGDFRTIKDYQHFSLSGR